MNYYQQPMYQPIFPQYYPMQMQPVPQMQPMQPMNQPVNQPNQQMQGQQTQPIIQKSNDIIPVKSRKEAEEYPVAPGNSVTFKDENEPYIYTKTMGFSQFDKPQFEAIRLVKETGNENENNEQIKQEEITNNANNNHPIDLTVFDNKFENINESLQILDDELKETKDDIDYLKNRIEELSKRRNRTTPIVKKEKVGVADV